MKYNERMEQFLQLQSKNIKFDDISEQLGVKPGTLKTFLNKRGYKFENGKYVSKEIVVDDKKETSNKNKVKQIEFGEVEGKETKKGKTKNTTSKKVSNVKSKSNNVKKTVDTPKKTSKVKPKKDRKINITAEDLDKLCEVYDWYLEIKDCKSISAKKKSTNKKDINIEEKEIKDLKSTSIRIDKKVWEDFERLCSNSQFSKQEIITQALKDFMKEYKHLI